MINTDIHNTLIENEIKNKILKSDIANQREKTALMMEKLKSALLVIGVIFIILLLLIVLYWIFPNKNFSSGANGEQITKCNCDKKIKETNQKFQTMDLKKQELPDSKDIATDVKKINGDEYVKKNNHVYKRTWEDGKIIKEVKFKPTIEETRKYGENIPQLAPPQQAK